MSDHYDEPDAVSDALGMLPHPARRLTVVGIGASAGGLSALQVFFAALPAATGLTFVVVVHLSPEHDSSLAELLQSRTQMPVQQVTGRVAMQPDHVYVIPPGRRLLVSDDHLDLAALEMPPGARTLIDLFFRSLAEQHGDGAAIILSGLGSDGAVGIQAIKEAGGLVFAQAPDEAEYDSMPRSAIATGVVDVVGTVAELAAQLVAAKQVHFAFGEMLAVAELPQAEQRTLAQILTLVRTRTGHDFTSYKRSTLLRRISRRMQLTHVATLDAYLHELRQDAAEAESLFHDLLIHVTEFFRDPQAWAALADTVIPRLFAGKGRGDQVRVWAAGCATGEEAYSLAMLLLEHAGTMDAPPQIQIFATDLGEAALRFARTGIYPEAISVTVAPERLARFFSHDDSHYQVRPEVRERVLFTAHNLLHDPPFSRLDLVVCRNLLIYLERDLQRMVFETFHYALRQSGYLFLGGAESPESAVELFRPVDKRHHIYERSGSARSSLPSLLTRVRQQTPSAASAHSKADAVEEAHVRLLEEVGPPSLLVNEAYQVLHFSETVGRYLLHPRGPLTADVRQLVRPDLQRDLQIALHIALVEGKATLTKPLPVQFNGESHPVALLVRPSPMRERALVLFLEGESPQSPPEDGDQSLRDASLPHVEAELRQTQEYLQTVHEEYQTTVEELRSANEELLSANEEYHSTLEELETSKEELQSLNEELQTLNQQLRRQFEEASQANSDLQNLFAATEIATIFLDRELHIKRYTPRAGDLLNLQPGDRGRLITHLHSNLHYEQLEADLRAVLANLTPLEQEVRGAAGEWFQMNIRPYRTLDDRIDGVVVTFVDITARKLAQQELLEAMEYADKIVQTLREPLLVLKPDLRVRLANEAFYTAFQSTPEQTEGRLIYELGDNQWDIPALRTLLEQVLPQNNVFNDFEIVHEFERGRQQTLLLNGRRLDHVQLILLAIEDITGRKQAEEDLLQLNATLEQRVEERTLDLQRSNQELDEFAYVASHDLRAPLRAIDNLAHWIVEDTGESLTPESQDHLAKLRHRVERMERLLVDLLEYSRAGRQRHALESVDAGMLVRNVVELLNLPPGFTVTLPKAMPTVVTERVALETVLRNLMGNAFKHHPDPAAGVVTIAVQVQDGRVAFTVSDNGVGIEPRFHTRIFEIFKTLKPRDEVEGSGMGLAVVKKLVESRGGTIHVTSAVNEGASFRFTWPISSSSEGTGTHGHS
jgi:two-component system CheB/CheR fusion protein